MVPVRGASHGGEAAEHCRLRAQRCPVTGTNLPLVVLSHGTVAWFAGHHDTAAALADAGFVVAAISHPGDTLSDPSRVGDLSILFERPAAIKRLIDHMTRTWPDHARINTEAIGFFGFSRGGYTGLAALGGIPDLPRAAELCLGGSKHPACDKLRANELPANLPLAILESRLPSLPTRPSVGFSAATA